MIGDYIQQIRKESNLSQEDFAERLNVELETLLNIENSIIAPTESFLSILSKEFDIPYKNYLGHGFPDFNADKVDLEIGQRIKRLREENGYSQIDLALKLGYSNAVQISYVEHGKRSLPKNKLMKLCNLFNISMDELLYGFKKKSNKYDLNKILNHQ